MKNHNDQNVSTYHQSVLVNEVLEYLNPQPNKVYLDATFGGGGHTKAILNHQPGCKVIALDWDTEAIDHNVQPLLDTYGDRLKILWGNFAHLYRILKKEKIDKVDGILADFGTSQYQIFEEDGFSFLKDTPLDMRMSSAHQRTTAAYILNNYEERRIADILFEYGEEASAKKIARIIVEERKKTPFATTKQLATLIEKIIPRKGKGFVHPATKTFQALRIEVNHELENIKLFLSAALGHLNPQGRLVFISFHSLEDRLVKTFFRDNQDKLSIITTKPVVATDEEMRENRSSRSAKLRSAEKKAFFD